jgi:hypothetical protein
MLVSRIDTHPVGVFPILQRFRAVVPRAVCTAKDHTFQLDAVSHDHAAAVVTSGREGMHCTFKTVESVVDTIHSDDKRPIVFIAANFAGHGESPYRTE